MPRFSSLIELTHKVSVGDKIAWIGEHSIESAGETTAPNTVTDIETRSDHIRVDGEGIRGGEYYYKAYENGATEAFHVLSDGDEYMGSVVMARLTSSDEPVPVKRVYDDLRGATAQGTDN